MWLLMRQELSRECLSLEKGMAYVSFDMPLQYEFYCIFFSCGVRPFKMGPTFLIHFKVCSVINYTHYVGQKKEKQILKFI